MENMQGAERFNLMLPPRDRERLEAIAEHEECASLAEMMRVLIRREAKRLGIQPRATLAALSAACDKLDGEYPKQEA